MPTENVTDEIVFESRGPRLDSRLEWVDRLAQRWAAGERERRSLHPLEKIRLLKDGAILGGTPIPTPEDILKFTECLENSPKDYRAIVMVWYTHGGSAQQKADRLRMSRSSLYIEWGRTLSYFRGWLSAHGIDS